MMRYALQLKLITILSIAFFIFGILFEISDFGNTSGSYSIAALYMALTGVYFYQLVFSTSISKMVQASPMKKTIQTSGSIVITLIFSLLTFTLYTIIRCIRITPEYIEDNEISWAKGYSTIPFMAVCIFILVVYVSFSYKSYILSIIFVAVSLLLFIFLGSTQDLVINISEKLLSGNSPVLIIIVSYVIILVGAAIGYLLSVILFKKEISDLSVRYALKSANK